MGILEIGHIDLSSLLLRGREKELFFMDDVSPLMRRFRSYFESKFPGVPYSVRTYTDGEPYISTSGGEEFSLRQFLEVED